MANHEPWGTCSVLLNRSLRHGFFVLLLPHASLLFFSFFFSFHPTITTRIFFFEEQQKTWREKVKVSIIPSFVKHSSPFSLMECLLGWTRASFDRVHHGPGLSFRLKSLPTRLSLVPGNQVSPWDWALAPGNQVSSWDWAWFLATGSLICGIEPGSWESGLFLWAWAWLLGIRSIAMRLSHSACRIGPRLGSWELGPLL